MAQKSTGKATSKRSKVAPKAAKKALKAKGAAKKPVKSAARKKAVEKIPVTASRLTFAKKSPTRKVKAKAKKPLLKVASKKSKPPARKAAKRNASRKAAKPTKLAVANAPKSAKLLMPRVATDIAARRASAAAVAALPHPGMMGDGTEEQNLNQRGVPGARITREDVAAAFRKSKPDRN